MCSKLKEGYIRMGQVNLQLAQEAEADENLSAREIRAYFGGV